MKKIEAIIRNSKLEDVKHALNDQGVEGMTITEVHGIGEQKGAKITYRGTDGIVGYVPRMKVEIVVDDDDADRVVDTIYQVAHTGQPGDGRIFVTEIESATRIRSGETEYGGVLSAGARR